MKNVRFFSALRALTFGWLIAGGLSADPAKPAPEVFQCFAGGWLDYQDGHYIEAMRSFHTVALMDTRFSPAITGMISSASMIGLNHVSESLRDYESAVRERTPTYGNFTRQFEPGVAFWGVYTDDESIEMDQVETVEQTLLEAIRKTTSLNVTQISPVSYETTDRDGIKAYNFNLLGLVSVEDNSVYLDLQLIHQFDIDSSQAAGLGYHIDRSLTYQREQIRISLTDFGELFESQKGLDFLSGFLTDGKGSLPPKFEPKYAQQSVSAFDADQHDIFDLMATQANRNPDFKLIASFMQHGSYDLNTKEPITPYIYEGLVNWLIGHMEFDYRELASLMEYYLATNHIRQRSEWGKRDPKELERIIKKYPETPGSALASLYFLTRQLTLESMQSDVGDQIEAYLEQIEGHRMIGKTPITFHYWSDRFHYTSTRQSIALNFKYFRDLVLTPLPRLEPRPEQLRRFVPMFSYITLVYDSDDMQFGLIAQAHFPKAMIDVGTPQQDAVEARAMAHFHSDHLNGQVNPVELSAALHRDENQSIYLTLLAANYAIRFDDTAIANEALKRVLQELDASKKTRVSFQHLAYQVERLSSCLPDTPENAALKASASLSSKRALGRQLPKETATPNIRTIVGALGKQAKTSDEAFQDMETKVFGAADQADIRKPGWIYQLQWYLKWLVRHNKTMHLQSTMARYEAMFIETLTQPEGYIAHDWQARLPLIIAENYIHAGQLADAERWLSMLDQIEVIHKPRGGSASERLAEQALVQARAYLAVIALKGDRIEQSAQYANEIIEWPGDSNVPLDKRLLVKIEPALGEKTILNSMEAALAVKVIGSRGAL